MSKESEGPKIVIIGAGIAGLVLGLALNSQLGLRATLYEQAPEFGENVGGAIGFYPNGFRVIQHISPDLLYKIRAAGFPYIYRNWMRHDGTTVAKGRESALCPQEDLQSIGIRRWKLQKCLYEEAVKNKLPVHFGKRLRSLSQDEHGGKVKLLFEDESTVEADIVFGADGIKSKVRESLFGNIDPPYTGITCLMGSSKNPRPYRGICFPSSITTKCHACYYPTGEDEQVFQIFFPADEKPENWGPLSKELAETECAILARKLEADGWSEEFLLALNQPDSVIRVGLRAREPLDKWCVGNVVLLGDAAHPPVPYIGQGAMMAVEDAGVLAELMRIYCLDENLNFNIEKFQIVLEMYEKLRIPRTRKVLAASHNLGASQQKRSESWWYNILREIWIKIQVWWYGTLPIMFEGSRYDCLAAVRILSEK